MPDIDKFTLEALEESGKTIENYTREESHGIITIKYDVVNRGKGAAYGAAAGSLVGWGSKLAVIGLSAFVPVATPIIIGTVAGGTFVGLAGGGAIGAAIGNRDNETHYFDSMTKGYLGNSRNKAAETANEKGSELYNSGDYRGAFVMFNAAYQKCTSGYSNENTFLNNRKKAETERDAKTLKEMGDKEYNAGRYESAKIKYHEAHDKSSVPSNKTWYKACALFANGRILWNEASEAELDQNIDRSDEAAVKFHQAKEAFEEAKSLSPSNSEYTKWIQMIELKIRGNHLFNSGDYAGAIHAFNSAYEKCSSDYSNTNAFLYNIRKAENERDAKTFKEMGDKEYNAGRYGNAKIKYQKAHDKSSVPSNKTWYKASALFVNGRILWDEAWEAEHDQNIDRSDEAAAQFHLAKESFAKAQSLSSSNSEYAKWIQVIELKIEGNELFNQGIELQEQGNQLKLKAKYQEAFVKYQEAKTKFQNGYNISKDGRFNACIDLVEDSINATNEVIRSLTALSSIQHLSDDLHSQSGEIALDEQISVEFVIEHSVN